MSVHKRATRTRNGSFVVQYRFLCPQHGIDKVITANGATIALMRREAESSIEAMLLTIKREYNCNEVTIDEEIFREPRP